MLLQKKQCKSDTVPISGTLEFGGHRLSLPGATPRVVLYSPTKFSSIGQCGGLAGPRTCFFWPTTPFSEGSGNG